MDTFAPFAPTVVTDHRPGVDGTPLVGLRDLVAGAVGRGALGGDAHGFTSVEALVVFDFGALRCTSSGSTKSTSLQERFASGADARGRTPISPVNAALASMADLVPGAPVLAQHESAQALAGRGRLVIDLEETARESAGLSADAHIETGQVVDALAGFVDRAGWTSVGVIAHPVHVARCVATCQRLGLRVVAAPTDHLAELWDSRSMQWWTRRRALWATRELAVVAHQMLAGRVLLRW